MPGTRKIEPKDGKGKADERPVNPWTAYSSNNRGPRLAGEIRDTLAQLLTLRVQIQREDQHLLTMAHGVHDDHRDAAAGLAEEIGHHGVGTHPVAEDMYGQHLRDANHADALVGSLAERVSRNGPAMEDPQ